MLYSSLTVVYYRNCWCIFFRGQKSANC